MLKLNCGKIGYPNYVIDEYGNVSNLNGDILKFSVNRSGYKFVRLFNSGKSKHFLLHRLVSLMFVDNPENKPEVNHINHDKLDNHYSNLEWCTRVENVKHFIVNKYGEDYTIKHKRNKSFTLNTIEKILKTIPEGTKIEDIITYFI